ncbi:RNA 2'-phosphotransferase [Tenacibaculum maritimum]|uniref:RNA 2'-phosphotransferase n=1 Tax=Tenacibaculum maritimum TaxID=107401 RepID=UPI0012E43E85|nr:RNA 2'-phosphotransferase [Tenacibaculum maritimum]CAA0178178.1 putative RNA 2'-phosphotransferase [Tenacibaculum maritimum]
MNEKRSKKLSKYLSLILRHSPETIHLKLDKNGWATISELLKNTHKYGTPFSIKELIFVVATNDKKRFSFNDDKTKIRANQGHSIKHINLNLSLRTPPSLLYHGTVAKFLAPIRSDGLLKMGRQYVHLSTDLSTANKVASRRGKPVILTIKALEMHTKGFLFYLSENDVWLTDKVPSEFIEF